MGVNVFIVGPRHSETIIFWSMFRQNERLLYIDEPSNRVLCDLPKHYPRQTSDDFIALYERNPSRLEECFAPIPLEEGLRSELTREQQQCLELLLTHRSAVACDFSRRVFKVADLNATDLPAVLVPLHRRRESVALSDLLLSGADTWRSRFGMWCIVSASCGGVEVGSPPEAIVW